MSPERVNRGCLKTMIAQASMQQGLEERAENRRRRSGREFAVICPNLATMSDDMLEVWVCFCILDHHFSNSKVEAVDAVVDVVWCCA